MGASIPVLSCSGALLPRNPAAPNRAPVHARKPLGRAQRLYDTGWWSYCDIFPTVIDVRAKVQVKSDREVLQLVTSLVESINLRAALQSAEAPFMRPWANVRRLGYTKCCLDVIHIMRISSCVLVSQCVHSLNAYVQE